MNVEKAIESVRKKGNQLDQLRLRCALGKPFTLDEAETVLTLYQFPDGSWDYSPPEENPDRIGSLGGTIHCLRWVREFGLGKRVQMTQTLQFLQSIQAPDGSFYETESKLAHSPHQWLQEERLIDQFYFTAAVPVRLFSLGYTDHPLITRALKWLRNYWNDWELVRGTWYNFWALLCMYPMDVGMDSSLYGRCYAKALEWLSDLEAQPLTWLLDSLQGAGFSGEESLVEKGIERLVALQDKDGTWGSGQTTVETKVTAVRLLSDYGIEFAL